MIDYIDEPAQILSNTPILHANTQPPAQESDTDSVIASARPSSGRDPGLPALGLGPGPFSQLDSETVVDSLDEASQTSDSNMSRPPIPPDKANDDATINLEHRKPRPSIHPVVAGPDRIDELEAAAAKAVAESDSTLRAQEQSPSLPCNTARVDSAQDSQDSVPRLSSSHVVPIHVEQHDGSTKPEQAPVVETDDSIANSPTLSKHVLHGKAGSISTLPVVQPSHTSVEDNAASVARKESLPSFQTFQHLVELADIATQQTAQQDHRGPPAPRHHSLSLSSAASQSPILQYNRSSFSGSTQTSPVNHHAAYARSPTNPLSEMSSQYGSPHQYPQQAYYSDRRSSTTTEVGLSGKTPAVPSLPSQSSSGDSYGNASSSTDGGYSTSHTTPTDGPAPTDGIQRPVLPPPPGMTVIPIGGFKCDFPGCTAIPFQTQYLLSSHRNVHSQNRPHYCPVPDCPRSEGGKGFKRKNEMIRHGLVHDSPGYICPFCPEREHRYPRPDNLQRHVRVHHVDRDKDDPALREVLAQRSSGATQKRRRQRANTGESA